MGIRFATLYLCEEGFSALMAMIWNKYWSQTNIET